MSNTTISRQRVGAATAIEPDHCRLRLDDLRRHVQQLQEDAFAATMVIERDHSTSSTTISRRCAQGHDGECASRRSGRTGNGNGCRAFRWSERGTRRVRLPQPASPAPPQHGSVLPPGARIATSGGDDGHCLRLRGPGRATCSWPRTIVAFTLVPESTKTTGSRFSVVRKKVDENDRRSFFGSPVEGSTETTGGRFSEV